MKKIGLIVLALVVAMGALGAGYAAWNQEFTIQGTANAATWDVSFLNAGATAQLANSPNQTREPVPGTYAFLTTSGVPGDKLYVTIENAYPGLVVPVYYVVVTRSTVPITFTDQVIDRGNLPAGCTINGQLPAGKIGPGYDDSEGNFTISFPSTLNLETLPSQSSYTFEISFLVEQAP